MYGTNERQERLMLALIDDGLVRLSDELGRRSKIMYEMSSALKSVGAREKDISEVQETANYLKEKANEAQSLIRSTSAIWNIEEDLQVMYQRGVSLAQGANARLSELRPVLSHYFVSGIYKFSESGEYGHSLEKNIFN